MLSASKSSRRELSYEIDVERTSNILAATFEDLRVRRFPDKARDSTARFLAV